SRLMRMLYKPVKAPLLITDVRSAELIKHASNSFLALKISFINAVSRICDRAGADVVKVAQGMGLDQRIGKSFLKAGAGYGGSCFPKDVAAFAWISKIKGYHFKLLDEIHAINEEQKAEIIKKIKDIVWNLQGKTVSILGLSFKPDTDDLRNAPSLDIIRLLLDAGVSVKAHDPVCMERVQAMFPAVQFDADIYAVLRDSDCLLLITEWREYRTLNFKRIKSIMRSLNVVDGRNLYDPQKIKKAGFMYRGVGRQ
ncbi:MAG: nucleotide sugar dehydrogenase, partial [Elusimicrobia bacterium]|nr:nucleotide sugar dehydrogenase [Elusimicrobiota bacterium]